MRSIQTNPSALLKIKCSLISLCMVVASISSSPVMSQGEDVDIDVPKIIQVQESIGVQGQPQSFVATVEDDRAVQYVTLYYRFNQSAEYTAEPMKQTADTRYEATVLMDNKTAGFVQYYIKAADTSGNITFRGHAFSPATVQLTPRPLEQSPEKLSEKLSEQPIKQSNTASANPTVTDPSITQTTEFEPVQSTKSGNRTLYTVLGVVAAVVIAGVAANRGGSDGGTTAGTDAGSSSGGGCSSAGCTVVFTSTAPQ